MNFTFPEHYIFLSLTLSTTLRSSILLLSTSTLKTLLITLTVSTTLHSSILPLFLYPTLHFNYTNLSSVSYHSDPLNCSSVLCPTLITFTLSTTLPSCVSYVLRLAPSPPFILQLHGSIVCSLFLILSPQLSSIVSHHISFLVVSSHLSSTVVILRHSSSFHLLLSHSLSLIRLSLFFLVSHHQLSVIACPHSCSKAAPPLI